MRVYYRVRRRVRTEVKYVPDFLYYVRARIWHWWQVKVRLRFNVAVIHIKYKLGRFK